MPAVSIVIPVYNSDEFLAGCLDSVVGQSMADLEVICVDDGSTDSSPSVLADYARRDERIRVLTQENAGQATARDRGLDAARGEYVMFLDNDDHFEPTAVEEAYERCVADEADITIFKIRYFDAQTDDSFVPDWALRMDLVPDGRTFNRRDMPATFFLAFTPALWNKIFRRDFLAEQALGFRADLRFTDDLAFTYPALVLAERISVIDKPLINYRTKREGSLWTKLSETPTDIVEGMREARDIIVSHGVMDEVEAAFANVALSQFLYNLSTVRTFEAFRLLYDALCSSVFAEFDLLERNADFWVRREEGERLARIVTATPEQYLLDEVHLKSALVVKQRERLKARAERIDRLTEKLDRASARQGTGTTLEPAPGGGTHSVRRAIAAVPRRLRRMLGNRGA